MGPVISKFRPISSLAGGTVVIVGKRLGHATQVSFDGLSAAIRANGTTRIKAVVPAGATSGPITVTTPYGTATVFGFVVT
jgi:large repetitive protein